MVGLGANKKTVVTGVEMFRKILDEGQAGDNVGLLLRGVDKDDLERGMVLARSGKGQRISVNAHGIVVTPAEVGSFEVGIQDGAVVVAARQGTVEVAGTNQSFTVPSGKSMRFETTTETVAQGRSGVGGQAFSPGVAAAIAIAVSAGVAIPVGWAIASALSENACEDAIQSVSPSAPTTQC